MRNAVVILVAGALLVVLSGCRQGMRPELTGLLAGAALSDDARDSLFDGRGGGRMALGLQTPVATRPDDEGRDSGPHLGGRVSFSGSLRDGLGSRPIADEPLLRIENYAEIGIVTLQATASWRAFPGRQDQARMSFFLEPGVGVGPSFGAFTLGEQLEFDGDVLARSSGTTTRDVSWAFSPFLRVGGSNPNWSVGAEVGWHWTGLHMRHQGVDLSRNPSEVYLGLFVGAKIGR